MIRRPKVLNELRHHPSRGYVENGGYNVKVRPKRCKRRIPLFWKNEHSNCWRDRSWKRHRSTQYHILKDENDEDDDC